MYIVPAIPDEMESMAACGYKDCCGHSVHASDDHVVCTVSNTVKTTTELTSTAQILTRFRDIKLRPMAGNTHQMYFELIPP